MGGRKVSNCKNDLQGDLSSTCRDLTLHTCIQNLTTLASAVPEIRLVPTKILMVHVTSPRPFEGYFVIRGLALAMINQVVLYNRMLVYRTTWINLPTKFAVSNSNHYEDTKYKMSKIGWFG